MKSNFLTTLATNWRDLLAFTLIGIGLAVAGGLVDYGAGRYADVTLARLVLPSLANYLRGFANFTGAAICATTLWMWLWPTVSTFGNEQFRIGWKALSDAGRFLVYCGLVAVALIAGAICFAA